MVRSSVSLSFALVFFLGTGSVCSSDHPSVPSSVPSSLFLAWDTAHEWRAVDTSAARTIYQESKQIALRLNGVDRSCGVLVSNKLLNSVEGHSPNPLSLWDSCLRSHSVGDSIPAPALFNMGSRKS